jgi:hypothetical protein
MFLFAHITLIKRLSKGIVALPGKNPLSKDRQATRFGQGFFACPVRSSWRSCLPLILVFPAASRYVRVKILHDQS